MCKALCNLSPDDYFPAFYQVGSRGTARISGLPMATSQVKYHDPHFLPHIARQHSKEKHHWLLEQARTTSSSVVCLHQCVVHNYLLQVFHNNIPIRDISAQLPL